MSISESFFQKHHQTIKIFILGVVALIMLIPLEMIRELVQDRQHSYDTTAQEVGKMWSLPQTISGPYIEIPGVKGDTNSVNVFPDVLNIKGEIETQTLHKSIYDVVVYSSSIIFEGSFITSAITEGYIKEDGVNVSLRLSDLRGIKDRVFLTFDGNEYEMTSSSKDGVIETNVKLDSDYSPQQSLPFSLRIDLKGSKSIAFAPIGNITEVDLFSEYTTPSFCGSFLPDERKIDDNGFSAHWKVLGMNRNNPDESTFGVELLIPVSQYQKTMRAIKYGILIILLVFLSAYLVEVSTKKEIHLLQYLLIGLALVLFYSLLLSISEYISFGWSYLISSSMTVILLGGYFSGILHKQYAYMVTILLIVLYAFIYFLLQMEAYSLLAGSLGLFLILGAIMYFSRK